MAAVSVKRSLALPHIDGAHKIPLVVFLWRLFTVCLVDLNCFWKSKAECTWECRIYLVVSHSLPNKSDKSSRAWEILQWKKVKEFSLLCSLTCFITFLCSLFNFASSQGASRLSKWWSARLDPGDEVDLAVFGEKAEETQHMNLKGLFEFMKKGYCVRWTIPKGSRLSWWICRFSIIFISRQ